MLAEYTNLDPFELSLSHAQLQRVVAVRRSRFNLHLRTAPMSTRHGC
jgi:hypothetical protein